MCGTAADRLLEQQAVGGDGEVDAAAADLAGEAVVVAVGSKPKSERRKPSLPRAAPWQLPVLQPARMKTGITSSWKLIGRSAAASLTVDRRRGLEALILDVERRLRRRRPDRACSCRAGRASASASLIGGLRGDVERDAVVARGHDDEPLRVGLRRSG